MNYETFIYHHGVKGMKWGIRKSPEQLREQYKQAVKKREHIGERKGVGSKAFNKQAKKAYALKIKSQIDKSTPTGRIAAKNTIAEAKNIKKPGSTSGYFNSYLKQIYGSKRTNQELANISMTENKAALRSYHMRSWIKPIAALAISVALPTAIDHLVRSGSRNKVSNILSSVGSSKVSSVNKIYSTFDDAAEAYRKRRGW